MGDLAEDLRYLTDKARADDQATVDEILAGLESELEHWEGIRRFDEDGLPDDEYEADDLEGVLEREDC